MQQDNTYTNETIKQVLSECTTWLDTLNHLKEESYFLKTKLSEIVDNNTNNDWIAEAENFHTFIIIRDESIRDMAADIKKQQKALRELELKNQSDKQWLKPFQKMRNEINYLKNDFAAMKEDFHNKFLKTN